MRELLHLMGMPHDYEIDSMKSVNHICQNVPVNTAQDWAEEVVRFCRGEAEMSSYTYLKQDNITQSIVENFPPTLRGQLLGSKASEKKRKLSNADIKSGKFLKKEIKDEIKTEIKSELAQEIKMDIMTEAKIELKEEIKGEMLLQEDEEMQSLKSLGTSLKNIRNRFTQKSSKETLPLPLTGSTSLEDDRKIEVIEVEEDYDKNGVEIKMEFQCGLCNFVAVNKRKLQSHWNTECPKQKITIECGVCKTQWPSTSLLEKHWETAKCSAFHDLCAEE